MKFEKEDIFMYLTWPYTHAFRRIRIEPAPQRGQPGIRLTKTKHYEGLPMYTYTHGLEPHVQATTERRLGEARKSEQIRIARAGRPGRFALVASSIRASVGALLISTGERLHQEPARSAATATLRRQVSGSTLT
jgi:hypothetical protein